MKILSALLVAATLGVTLSPVQAEPRNPNAAPVPIEQALARKAVVEGRQAVIVDQGRPASAALSDAERSIIERNQPQR